LDTSHEESKGRFKASKNNATRGDWNILPFKRGCKNKWQTTFVLLRRNLETDLDSRTGFSWRRPTKHG